PDRPALLHRRVLRRPGQGEERRRATGGPHLLHPQEPHRRHAEGGQSVTRGRTILMLLSLLLMVAPARKARARAASPKARPAAGARTVLLPSPNNPLVAVRLYFD